MRFLLIFIFLSLSIALHAQTLSLTPPKGWECIKDPEQLPQKIRMIYVGGGKSQFSPSINLASEETSLGVQDYMNLAKSYHEGQGDTWCKSLGTLETKVGKAHLMQIDRVTQWGNVRFLQAVVIFEQTAYVITATCLQEEFAALSPQFIKAIQSFSLIPEI